jgi:hypothetical protein
MNKKIEMAKIETKKGMYYIYKCINAGKIQYNVYLKGEYCDSEFLNNQECFCDSFEFYKDALNDVLTFI